MSHTQAQKTSSSTFRDEMMRPRSPRPVRPSKDYRSRLRPAVNIHAITKHRTLNPENFPNRADCLDELVEAGAYLSGSDTEEDSDYELPPPNFHREGDQLPSWRVAWYNGGVAESAKELAERPLSPVSDTDHFDREVINPEPESDADLDSPSRQLKEELSQMSQSESHHVDEAEEYDPLAHPEVLQFITKSPLPNLAHFHDDNCGPTLKSGARLGSGKRRRLA